jgi:Mn-containing catalase
MPVGGEPVPADFVRASDVDSDSRQNKREMARAICDEVGIPYRGNYIPSSGNVSRKFLQEILNTLQDDAYE